MKKITVFIGVQGSGKDFNGNLLCEHGAVQVSFADKLREDIWELIGWSPASPEEYDAFKKATFQATIADKLVSFTGRGLLVKYATDIRRREDPDHWCKQLRGRIAHVLEIAPAVVVTDCRFMNEVRHLIQISEEVGAEIEFVFCNFKSERYNPSFPHESEWMAQYFLNWGFEDKDPRFDRSIKSMVENKLDSVVEFEINSVNN